MKIPFYVHAFSMAIGFLSAGMFFMFAVGWLITVFPNIFWFLLLLIMTSSVFYIIYVGIFEPEIGDPNH